MGDRPWQGDACSLVDAFRSGERSPVEELEASLTAIEATELNCFSFLDADAALQRAAEADVDLPFGGVPTGIKELEPVEGWPHTEASVVFKDRVADHTSTVVERLRAKGGANPVGLTISSEFGGLNISNSKLNGVTHNPWRHGRSAGGSSGGSSSAVAGGLVSLATGGDGGGSIRIPAGYCGLLGMKGTFGRIPRGPMAWARPNTVVLGCQARSVRDAARYYDVCAGHDRYDPTSLPARVEGWEASLGTEDLDGLRVAVLPDLGYVPLQDGVEAAVRDQADALIAEHGWHRVDIDFSMPNLAGQWMMGNVATLLADLEDRWPSCASDLTDEIALGLRMSTSLYNIHTAAVAERQRLEAQMNMADAFGEVDLILCATNPGPAFDAAAAMSATEESFIDKAKDSEAARWAFRAALFGVRAAASAAPALPNRLIDEAARRFPDLLTMGGLTIPANICGNPAVSIPGATVDGLPIGLQVIAPHHADALLLDVALSMERLRPWPLVAPAAA